jgi:anti-sigma B factor antagonist
MLLEMTIDRLDPVSAVVTISGSLTLGTNLKMLEAQVRQLIIDGVDRLVLDLTGCSYSDSAGLGFLMLTNGMIVERGGTMRLCGVSDRVMSLLKMTTTDKMLPCDPNRQVSIDLLGPMESA